MGFNKNNIMCDIRYLAYRHYSKAVEQSGMRPWLCDEVDKIDNVIMAQVAKPQIPGMRTNFQKIFTIDQYNPYHVGSGCLYDFPEWVITPPNNRTYI